MLTLGGYGFLMSFHLLECPMNKLKAGLVALGSLAIGVVTLRTVRAWRAPTDEPEMPIEEALAETEAAADHSAAAARHARVAGAKAVEYAREELVPASARDDGETALPKPVRRLRRVGKGWIRR
jgi:hypothetical protein